MAALRILLLTFTSRFVIDFLSIRKVIIFSAIATDDRHPLRSRSIHQNAANCMTIRFRYIAQPRGVRKTYCARSRNDVRRLTSRSNGMPSKKIMESLRTFGLQKRTGPSSGVVASIVLVSPGLECPGVSLAEVCATGLRCHLW